MRRGENVECGATTQQALEAREEGCVIVEKLALMPNCMG
jgi:hypothetical protein